VYLSALVHDVGKIGVPEAVLTKPGRLTPAEFEMVKAHPELGVRIVERIPQMRDLIPGVLHHHEKYNGSGYPHGLAGTDIPLFGRIICLADSFDAMSSSRTYRSAMPVDNVFRELTRCSGTHFDPELAQAFMQNVDLARYYAMLSDHQQHRSPLRQVMRMSA
jgi:HD-GYP domain-containing protein (c-di-GMP phosphodiesterase class II)